MGIFTIIDSKLVSHVLYGAIEHEEIVPYEDEKGEWSMLSLTHARAAKETGYNGPTKPIEGRFSIRTFSNIFPSGVLYQLRQGTFIGRPSWGILPLRA